MVANIKQIFISEFLLNNEMNPSGDCSSFSGFKLLLSTRQVPLHQIIIRYIMNDVAFILTKVNLLSLTGVDKI